MDTFFFFFAKMVEVTLDSAEFLKRACRAWKYCQSKDVAVTKAYTHSSTDPLAGSDR